MTGLFAIGAIAWLLALLAVVALIALPLVAWHVASVLGQVRDELRDLRATVEDWRQAFERAQHRGATGPSAPAERDR